MTATTLLLRQIHPSFIKLDRVTSQAFRPTPKDEQKLSVYDGDQISPAASWKHYRDRKLESVGVMAVTIEECSREQLVAEPSPELFPEHAHIDFQDFNGNQCEKKSKKLKQAAECRGWLYQAD
jgi:hypothetical protein